MKSYRFLHFVVELIISDFLFVFCLFVGETIGFEYTQARIENYIVEIANEACLNLSAKFKTFLHLELRDRLGIMH